VVSSDTVGNAVYVLHGNANGTFLPREARPPWRRTRRRRSSSTSTVTGRNDIAVPGSANALSAGPVTVSVLHNLG